MIPRDLPEEYANMIQSNRIPGDRSQNYQKEKDYSDEKGIIPHFWCLSFLAVKTFLIAVPG